jgi:hypothetical protein
VVNNSGTIPRHLRQESTEFRFDWGPELATFAEAHHARPLLFETLSDCGSGQALIQQNRFEEVSLAAALDVTDVAAQLGWLDPETSAFTAVTTASLPRIHGG